MGGSKPAVNGLFNLSFSKKRSRADGAQDRPSAGFEARM